MTARSAWAMVWCLLGAVVVAAQSGPAAPPAETVAADIPGVVAGGSKVQLVWTGFESADGIIGAADGSLLFTEQMGSRVSRIAPDGKIAVEQRDTNGAGALAIDGKGQLIDVERMKQQVRVLAPVRKVLMEGFEGEPLAALRDLCVDKKGGLYITDGSAKGPQVSSVYYISPAGRISKVAGDVEVANGVLLSPDEKTLYVSNTPKEYVLAYDVQADGSITNRRNFARLEAGDRTGGDGLAIDGAGRVYVATPPGVQIFDAQGKYLGTIPTPRPTTSIAFAGPDKKTLYIVGRGAEGPGDQRWARSIYKVAMVAQGFKDRAK